MVPTHNIDRSAQSAGAIMIEWWRSTEDNEIDSERHISGDLVDGQKEMFLIGGSWRGDCDSLGAMPAFTVQLHEKQCK